MKQFLLFLACMLGISAFGQSYQKNRKMDRPQSGTKITIATPGTNCQIALISNEEAAGGQYGWWSVWHELKEEGITKTTPATYEGVPAGDYTLVVYLSNADFNGEASSDGIALENIQIRPYLKELNYSFEEGRDFKDWNCLSCPWLCVYNGESYVKQEEVIKDVVGFDKRTTTTASIAPEAVIDGKVKIQIREEKDEISYLDQVVLEIDGQIIQANQVEASLSAIDAEFYQLHKGESVDFEFEIPQDLEGEISVHVSGYYHPSPEFMAEITARLLND